MLSPAYFVKIGVMRLNYAGRPSVRSGSALPEVIVAAFIMSFVAVTVGALLLSSNVFSKDTAIKYAMAQEAGRLRSILKNYVTADTSVTLNAPGSPPWHLPEDSTCNQCWALQAGEHDATALLAADLRDKYKATLKYVVKVEKFGGSEVRKVSIKSNWEMPQ